MTVQDLIDKLSAIDNKDLEVFMRMDSWSYNPWYGELTVNKDGCWLD